MKLTMKDVMTANCQIPNAEMLTSNHCAALARELNKLLADALAAQRDEGLAREAELNRRISTLEGDGSWGEMALTVKVESLQQRLAEAEKLLRKVCKEDWSGAKTAHIEEFLASRGCADGEKS